ncbi:MAG: hypothetical protein PHO87_04560 [Acholeplasmataceae bacterium]|nr:hypothetical protein [Acholeplasmataceae bacterium]
MGSVRVGNRLAFYVRYGGATPPQSTMENMTEELKTILNEMCLRVNANPEEIDFKSKDWYLKHTWTIKEQDDFIKWLADFLYTNKKARKLFNMFSSSKKSCNHGAMFFVSDYGWKTI